MLALNFPNNAYLAAFVSAFLTTLLVLPLWRVWCERIGLVDDSGHRKIHAPKSLAQLQHPTRRKSGRRFTNWFEVVPEEGIEPPTKGL